MTAKELAGRRLYLILASALILEQATGLALVLTSGNLSQINWLKSVVQPIGFALAVGFLWRGDNTLRWFVALGCIAWGATMSMLMGTLLWALHARTPADKMDLFLKLAFPLMFVLAVALFDVLAGLLFLLSPSMKAFFERQRAVRESADEGAESEDAM